MIAPEKSLLVSRCSLYLVISAPLSLPGTHVTVTCVGESAVSVIDVGASGLPDGTSGPMTVAGPG